MTPDCPNGLGKMRRAAIFTLDAVFQPEDLPLLEELRDTETDRIVLGRVHHLLARSRDR